MSKKAEHEQREHWDDAIESGIIDSELRPTRMRVTPANELTSMISFRISVDEHRRIREAAESLGLSMSDYLRAAALAFADRSLKAEMAKELDDVQLLHDATELSRLLVAKLEQLQA